MARAMQELAGLSEEDRNLALARFQMLRPHLEDDVALRVVAEAAEIPFRTAQRWVAQYWFNGSGSQASLRPWSSPSGFRQAQSSH